MAGGEPTGTEDVGGQQLPRGRARNPDTHTLHGKRQCPRPPAPGEGPRGGQGAVPRAAPTPAASCPWGRTRASAVSRTS